MIIISKDGRKVFDSEAGILYKMKKDYNTPNNSWGILINGIGFAHYEDLITCEKEFTDMIRELIGSSHKTFILQNSK